MNVRLVGKIIVVSMIAVWPSFATADTVTPGVRAVAHGANSFAMDLYGQLAEGEGNLFFSPYSIDLTLAMVHAGAAGATADEMSRTLELPALQAGELDAGMAGLSRQLSADVVHDGCELHVANGMWAQLGQTFSQRFINRVRMTFGAKLGDVDFLNPQAAAETINQWASEKTNDRIKNLISPNVIRENTQLVLTNAIYFNGSWAQPFKTQFTSDAFWNEGGASNAHATSKPAIRVRMMNQTGEFDFVRDGKMSALQMPYRGGNLAMLVLLPDDPAGLSDLEKTLDLLRLKAIVSELQREPIVDLSFPKFRFDTHYDLVPTLTAMGMPTVFSNTADLSGIDGTHNLSIKFVVHQAFVRVDETGTEAAAATGSGAGGLGAEPPHVVFRADHPFVFVIRDLKTGTILFMGRVMHPDE